MIRAGDTIENPVTGERITFLQTCGRHERRGGRHRDDRAAERLRRRGTRPPARRASASRSSTGTLGLKIGGEKIDASARRQSLSSSRARPTASGTRGDDEVRFVCEVRPALQFEQLLRDDVRARRRRQDEPEGDAEPVAARRDRAGPLRHRPAAVPTAWPQRAGLALGAPLGRLLGYGLHTEPTPRRPAPYPPGLGMKRRLAITLLVLRCSSLPYRPRRSRPGDD